MIGLNWASLSLLDGHLRNTDGDASSSIITTSAISTTTASNNNNNNNIKG